MYAFFPKRIKLLHLEHICIYLSIRMQKINISYMHRDPNSFHNHYVLQVQVKIIIPSCKKKKNENFSFSIVVTCNSNLLKQQTKMIYPKKRKYRHRKHLGKHNSSVCDCIKLGLQDYNIFKSNHLSSVSFYAKMDKPHTVEKP